MVQILQIAVSLILFGNKVFILRGKKLGWLVGIIGCSLGTIYFYMIHLYVFTALEVGLIALMIYGYFFKEKKNILIERIIYSVAIASLLCLLVFAFSGLMTVYEFISSLCFLFGTYCLTHKELDQTKTNTGWILYCIAHAFSAYLGYGKHQTFFADMQIASIIASLAGMNFKTAK